MADCWSLGIRILEAEASHLKDTFFLRICILYNLFGRQNPKVSYNNNNKKLYNDFVKVYMDYIIHRTDRINCFQKRNTHIINN